MKKIKYIVAVLVLACLTSCLDKDLLDTTPKDRLSNDNFWQNVQDAEYAVNRMYNFLDGDLIGYDLYSDILIDNYAYDSDNRRIQKGIHQSNLGVFNGEWTKRYQAIRAANNFLENVDKVIKNTEDTEELAKLERMKSEAYFLRAYAHTYLVFLFGDVPYIEKAISTSEASSLVREKQDEVWKKIFADYDKASANLPETYEAADYGRFTKGAAYAMKARAALWAGEHKLAYENAKKVIDMAVNNNRYELHSSFETLFKHSGEASKETILARVYIGGGSHNRNSFSNRVPKSLKNGDPYYSANKNIADAFQMSNGKDISDPTSGFDPKNPYVNRDPRMKLSLFVNHDKLYGLAGNPDYPNVKDSLVMNPGTGTPDDVSIFDLSTPTGFYVKKYVDVKDYESPGLGGTDFMVIRYADVLLIAAEALIDSDGSLSEAAGYINQVRLRAGIPDLATSGVSTSDRTQMRKALRNERLVELAFEGSRYFDILRWRIAETVMQGDMKGMRYVEADEVKTIVLDYTMSFDKNRDYLWPIPSKQIKLAPTLSQNNGY
jgi:hypothetical protein